MMLKISVARCALSIALVAPGFGAANPAAAQDRNMPAASQDAQAAPAEVSIPNTRRIVFTSKVNGHRYQIDVALPHAPPPPLGYPVLYVLDGYAYFASATEAARGNGNAPNAIVVGIGYPNDPAFIADVKARHGPPPPYAASLAPFHAAVSVERQLDLSLPASQEILDGQSLPGFGISKPSDVGGIGDFLKTIETEVKPRVAALAKVDTTNQALFGHSLGGLAVLQALFTQPDAFKTFIAASPSIWWADNAVLAGEADFAAKVESGAIHPRVLVTIGDGEEDVPKLPASMGVSQQQVEALIRKSRMIGNACDLVTRLKAMKGKPPYEVGDCAIFKDQHHGISPWPAIGLAISFAFPPLG
ncbi:alpha/beta hydrolase [Sphingosinicella rhizophila]|uniref:Alpha/beta hydrolase-fold protein n=1 Tax=Sphingosinicella rhizophila TaxID=3050082 RepID=A0ABU3QBF5_9SPHN|nr:alpha/beta hydrolase-fold protein [Sphingosinicella sp. GR2756]MDT9600738.1 alpha/beta hydrolase-fold protein [Sphingosinicella sp. GR2756]